MVKQSSVLKKIPGRYRVKGAAVFENDKLLGNMVKQLVTFESEFIR